MVELNGSRPRCQWEKGGCQRIRQGLSNSLDGTCYRFLRKLHRMCPKELIAVMVRAGIYSKTGKLRNEYEG